MVRFKVIKGSHLLLTVAAVLLLAVIAFILIQEGLVSKEELAFERRSDSMAYTESTQEAKALSVFASNLPAANTLKIEVAADASDEPPLCDAPCILIYHTHTHEAYEQEPLDPYEALETWRTEDETHSVVRVGEALAQALEELGCFVMHDTTDHEQNDIDMAYVRSLETLESYSMEFDLCIDLHRDAYVEGMLQALQTEHGSQAQLMLLVGRGDAYTGDAAPDYCRNLDFAQRLTSALNQHTPGICRNITVKTGRYNQHIGKAAILVEVGHTHNTLKEALASVPCLAECLFKLLNQN